MRDSAAAQNLQKTNPFLLMALYLLAKVFYYVGYRVLDVAGQRMAEVTYQFLTQPDVPKDIRPLLAELRDLKPVDEGFFIGMLMVRRAPLEEQRLLVFTLFSVEIERVYGYSNETVLDWVRDLSIDIEPDGPTMSAEEYYRKAEA